jgi:hypothetical protein
VKYKRFKSAAHNFGDSFCSDSNYSRRDFVMSYLSRAALASGASELRADLLSGHSEPDELLPEPVRHSLNYYIVGFPSHLENEGVSISAVRAATMRLRFDPTGAQILKRLEGGLRVPFRCEVKITDDRGVAHTGMVENFWVCNSSEPGTKRRRFWWQFWRPAA